MAKLARGAQFHQFFKRTEWAQGFEVAQGREAVLPYTLADRPQSAQALKLFISTSLTTQSRLVCQGIEYSVDPIARQITWLKSARWPLQPSDKLVFDYWSYGATA